MNELQKKIKEDSIDFLSYIYNWCDKDHCVYMNREEKIEFRIFCSTEKFIKDEKNGKIYQQCSFEIDPESEYLKYKLPENFNFSNTTIYENNNEIKKAVFAPPYLKDDFNHSKRIKFMMLAIHHVPHLLTKEIIPNDERWLENLSFSHLLSVVNDEYQKTNDDNQLTNFQWAFVKLLENLPEEKFCQLLKIEKSYQKKELLNHFANIYKKEFITNLVKVFIAKEKFMNIPENEELFCEVIGASLKKMPEQKKGFLKFSQSLQNHLLKEQSCLISFTKNEDEQWEKIVFKCDKVYEALCLQDFEASHIDNVIKDMEKNLLWKKVFQENFAKVNTYSQALEVYTEYKREVKFYFKLKKDSIISKTDVENMMTNYVLAIKENNLSYKDTQDSEKMKMIADKIILEYTLPKKENEIIKKNKI